MATVAISSKSRVVIPKGIREKLGLSLGQRMQVIVYGERIELIPLRPAKETRGFLKGIDTTVRHEADRV